MRREMVSSTPGNAVPVRDTSSLGNSSQKQASGSAATRPASPVRVLYVLTAPFGLEKTLGGQLRYLRSAGFEPFFACSPGEELPRFAAREGACGEAVPIEREIAPLQDLWSVWKLWRLMRRIRPRLTNVSAPKAGLLGGLAARLAGVPCRVYTLRGLRLETTRGWKYYVLWAAEWLACRLAHRVVCVSGCLARRLLELRLAPPGKVLVAASGSSNGVEARHFAPTPAMARRARRLRRRLRIPSGALVLGFIGRLTRDKGIAELFAAYNHLRKTKPQLRLLLVGCFESGDPVPAGVRDSIEHDPEILVTGFVDDPAPYYLLMDVVALPTHREGYPTVALEAAAACRPFVTTRVTGAADAVEDGVTGLLVRAGDAYALAEAVASLLENPKLAAAMARRAQQRALTEFSQQRVWQALEQIYRALLAWRDPEGTTRLGAARRWSGRSSFLPRPAAGSGQWRDENAAPDGARRVPANSPDSCARAVSCWAQSHMKRALDILVSSVGLLAASPLLLLAAGIIGVSMGRPILFRQERVGLAGTQFLIYKFRTMAGDDSQATATDVQRLTPSGRLLRRWSLDELPQLWNVLRGEMSLVGPRPLPIHYERRYTARQRRRHDVRPGLTGWAQVLGRNALSWEQRFDLDLWYVQHTSFWLDFQILIRSIAMVVGGAGVTPRGAALMPEFLGDSHDSL
jgi:lipopolysaccharide/colanic/teichoic acid biosynthesis glycosyltransferase/glycosyltransferase involved in cell wall biosynthesis